MILFNKQIVYIGWISNLQGTLFFNLFNPYGFRLDKTIGEIFYFKEKNSDFIFWSGLFELFDNGQNEQNLINITRVFFIAKRKNDSLKGSIYINFIENKDKNKEKINDLFEYTKKEKTYEDYENKIQKIEDLIKIDFFVEKNGIIKLFELENLGQTKLKFQDDISENDFYTNIFLIIKSLFHKDRFHGKRNEDITKILKYKKYLSDVENVKEALIQTAYNIQQYIAEEKNIYSSKIYIIIITNYLMSLLLIIKDYDENFYEKNIEKIKHLKNYLLYEYNTENERKKVVIIRIIYTIFGTTSFALMGSYKILQINAAEKSEKLIIVKTFWPDMFFWFIMLLIGYILLERILTKFIPINISNNPILKFFLNIWHFIEIRMIKYTKPTIGKNFLTKKVIPWLRIKMRRLRLKIL